MTTKLDPRHKWLENRLNTVLDEIRNARESRNLPEYRMRLRDLVVELQYISEEWMKYYPGEF